MGDECLLLLEEENHGREVIDEQGDSTLTSVLVKYLLGDRLHQVQHFPAIFKHQAPQTL